MDSPQKVYQLFQGLGYKTLDPSYKGKEAWGLREKDKEFIKQIYAIANYKKKFQIFLVELKTLSPGILREIPSILKEKSNTHSLFSPLIIKTIPLF